MKAAGKAQDEKGGAWRELAAIKARQDLHEAQLQNAHVVPTMNYTTSGTTVASAPQGAMTYTAASLGGR